MNDFSIVNLKRGAAVELADEEMRRIAEDIVDPEKVAKKKRTLVLKLTFEPIDEDRDEVRISVEAQSTLAPRIAALTKAYVMHTRDGVQMAERDHNQPGLFDETPSDDQNTGPNLRAVEGSDS